MLMDLAQGKGEQGHGIGDRGVVDGRLHERVLHRQPSHLGGATDDLGDPLRWQGGQRHLQERCVQAGGGLNPPEEIGAQREQHLHAVARLHAGTDQPEEQVGLLGLHQGEEFLRLIHADQHGGLGRPGVAAQRGGQVAEQPIQAAVSGGGTQFALQALRIAPLAEAAGQGQG
jgi:hypothetical protein